VESISDRLSHLFFENSWPILSVVGLIWAVVLILHRANAKPATAMAMSVLPIVAGLLLLLSFLVDTDRELIDRTLTDIIAAAERKDAAGVLAHFELPDSSTDGGHTQAWLEARLKLGLGYVDRLRLHAPEVTVRGDSATCVMEVTAPPRLILADLEWKKTGGKWKVSGLKNPRWRIGPSQEVKVP